MCLILILQVELNVNNEVMILPGVDPDVSKISVYSANICNELITKYGEQLKMDYCLPTIANILEEKFRAFYSSLPKNDKPLVITVAQPVGSRFREIDVEGA